MIDPPLGRPSFEATPTRVGARGPGRALFVGVVVVAFLVLALLKPWGGDEPRTAVDPTPPALSPAPSTATPSRTTDSAIEIGLGGRSPDVDGRAPRPARMLGDPVSAAAPLVVDIAGRADGWGIGAGGWDEASAGRASWTSWQQTTPKPWDDPAVLLGFVDRERVCGVDPHLRTGAAMLAVTSPPGVVPDWVVSGWVVGPDGTTVLAPRIERIAAATPGGGGLSALVFADGSPWADGIYRLLVQGSGTRLAIDICLGSGSSVTDRGGAAGPTDGIIRTITGGLVGRSGEWGIGAGGPDGSGGGAWVVWRATTPVSESRSSELRPPPSCATDETVRAGILVALTVPDGLTPDWRAAAVRFVDGRLAPGDEPMTQVSPMGNRGIAYLVRRDGSAWPAGAYRFRVQTASSSVSMDACLVGD